MSKDLKEVKELFLRISEKSFQTKRIGPEPISRVSGATRADRVGRGATEGRWGERSFKGLGFDGE